MFRFTVYLGPVGSLQFLPKAWIIFDYEWNVMIFSSSLVQYLNELQSRLRVTHV